MRGSDASRMLTALLAALLVLIAAYLYATSTQPAPQVIVKTVTVTRVVTRPTQIVITEREMIQETTTVRETVTHEITATVTSTSVVTITVTYNAPWENNTSGAGGGPGTQTSTTTTIVTTGRTTSTRQRSVASSNRGSERAVGNIVQVEIDGDKLVVRAEGGISTIGFYKSGDIFPYVSVGLEQGLLPLLGGRFVDPLYVRITRDETVIVAPLNETLNGSSALVVVWNSEGSLAKFRIERVGRSYRILDFRVIGEPVDTCKVLREEGYDTLYALVCGINKTSIAAIREALGTVLRGASGDTIWGLLAWEEKHIRYNGSVEGVETPLEMLKTRQGKCIDYAVFTVAALLAAGFREAYIVQVGGGILSHAFAAVPYHGTIVVLDQRRPPAELTDYMYYMIGADNETDVYYYRVRWLNGSVVVETGRIVKPRELRDLWPLDKLPNNVVEGAAEKLAALLGARLDRRAAEDYRIAYDLSLCLCKLRFIPLPCLGCEVAKGKLYSPIFAKQWETYIAEEIYKELVKVGVRRGEYSTLWLEYRDESETSDDFTVYLR